MIPVLAEFYLEIYSRLFNWLIKHAAGDTLPTNEGDKWEYSILHTVKGKKVLRQVTEIKLGYKGSYFYQKKMEANRIIKKQIQGQNLAEPYLRMDSDLLKKIFVVLGCQGNNNQFSSLYEEFCNLFEINSEIVNIQNELIKDYVVSESASLLSENKLDTFDEVTENYQLDRAVSTVYKFYKSISAKKYEDAWNILYPSFRDQHPWLGNYERFKEGYDNFRRIDNQAVFNAKIDGTDFSCLFYYEDDTKIHLINDVPNFPLMKVSQIEEFIKQVKDLADAFAEMGAKGFENMQLQKLFDPAASEYIWYKYGFSSKRFYELFPDTRSVSVTRLYKISCVFSDNKWLINDINHLKTYTVRD